MTRLRQHEPHIEAHWDGWWLVEHNGTWVTGPFGAAEAEEELRWARALHNGVITLDGREELRRRRRARELEAEDRRKPHSGWFVLVLLVSLLIWVSLVAWYR